MSPAIGSSFVIADAIAFHYYCVRFFCLLVIASQYFVKRKDSDTVGELSILDAVRMPIVVLFASS